MEQLDLLLATLTGLASAGVVGFAKSIDTRIVAKLGNLTPVLVIVVSMVLPKLAALLHLSAVPDAAVLVNAPVATGIAVLAREAYVWITKKLATP